MLCIIEFIKLVVKKIKCSASLAFDLFPNSFNKYNPA